MRRELPQWRLGRGAQVDEGAGVRLRAGFVEHEEAGERASDIDSDVIGHPAFPARPHVPCTAGRFVGPWYSARSLQGRGPICQTAGRSRVFRHFLRVKLIAMVVPLYTQPIRRVDSPTVGKEPGEETMTPERMSEAINAAWAAFSAGDLDGFVAGCAESIIYSDNAGQEPLHGLDAFRGYASGWFEASSDRRSRPMRKTIDGCRVATEIRLGMTRSHRQLAQARSPHQTTHRLKR